MDMWIRKVACSGLVTEKGLVCVCVCVKGIWLEVIYGMLLLFRSDGIELLPVTVNNTPVKH